MGEAVTTIDHDKIRRWVESNNGRPACIAGTGGDGDIGMLRIDFDEPEKNLKEISWEQWFEAFEKNRLALLHSTTSRFNKLVSRNG